MPPSSLRQPSPKAPSRVVAVDRVVAVVNDEAITQHDVDDSRRVVLQQMKQQGVQSPAPDVLDKQVLERLITERSLLQFAKETGLRVDDTQIERTIQRIAQDNKLSPEEFRNGQMTAAFSGNGKNNSTFQVKLILKKDNTTGDYTICLPDNDD